MKRFQHDTDRWLRNQAKIYTTRGNTGMACVFERCADDYANLLTRHNALVEAVAWLLDAQSIVDENITCPNWRRHVGISDIVRASRAEVDRLIANGADDCKGEG